MCLFGSRYVKLYTVNGYVTEICYVWNCSVIWIGRPLYQELLRDFDGEVESLWIANDPRPGTQRESEVGVFGGFKLIFVRNNRSFTTKLIMGVNKWVGCEWGVVVSTEKTDVPSSDAAGAVWLFSRPLATKPSETTTDFPARSTHFTYTPWFQHIYRVHSNIWLHASVIMIYPPKRRYNCRGLRIRMHAFVQLSPVVVYGVCSCVYYTI